MKKLLVDTDWLVGIFRNGDPHYKSAAKSLAKQFQSGNGVYVLNLVIQETGTVLSHRTGMGAVKLFWEKLPKLRLKIIWLDEVLEAEAWTVFLRQTKKGCSFVDCANLAVIDKYKLGGILSFDEFYPKELRLV